MSEKKSGSQLIAVGSIIIVALLALVGWLAYSKAQQSKLLQKHEMALDEAEQVKVELEKEYYEALSDLEELRSDNTELNAMIEEQKGELAKQKSQISGLITTKKDLAAARDEIAKLKASAEEYIGKITKLQEENQALLASNESLSQEKELLTTEVNKERQMNDELMTVKASLMEEKENLEGENDVLNRKVTKASVIGVSEISVEGFMIKDSGKESKKKKADKVDILKICFKAHENDVAEEGGEEFFIRVINPNGETIAIESLGSGTLTTNEGEEIRYTQVQELSYTGEEAVSCLSWQPEMAFNPGNYELEVYNKGYLSGKSTFTLK